MEAIPLWLPPLFLVIALVYAGAGLGGGSAYVAVLALMGLPQARVAQTALVCNLIVTAGGIWHLRRGGHLDFGFVLPFIVLSVPMAYIGGMIRVERGLFLFIAGAALLVAGGRMLLANDWFARHAAASDPVERARRARRAWITGPPIGAALGLLAGVLGLGGGIFLAPVLLLAGWAGAQETAAVTSVFVFVNSAAGLAGHVHGGFLADPMLIPLGVAVLIGGQIGSRFASYRPTGVGVRRMLAAVIVVISVRLLWGALL